MKEENIPDYLRKVITYGTIVKSKIISINERQGYEKIYKYNSEFYVIAAIGLNGFIVSAYPTRKYRR